MNGQSKVQKVVILDSIKAVAIGKQLIQGDVARAENKIFRQMDSVSKSRISTLKESIKYLNMAYDEKQLEANQYKDAVKNQEKIIRKEKSKKNFYKITSGVGLTTTILLLLLR
jgi:hypothetical protein